MERRRAIDLLRAIWGNSTVIKGTEVSEIESDPDYNPDETLLDNMLRMAGAPPGWKPRNFCYMDIRDLCIRLELGLNGMILIDEASNIDPEIWKKVDPKIKGGLNGESKGGDSK